MRDKHKEKCHFDGCDEIAKYAIDNHSLTDNEDNYGVYCLNHYSQLAIQETDE